MRAPLHRGESKLFAAAATAVLLTATAFAALGRAQEMPVLVERIPDSKVFCSVEGKEERLLRSLAGRPAVIFVTDPSGAESPLAKRLGVLQEEYFYWFTWAGLLVGEAGPEETKSMHSRSPLHLERCFGDREGKVREALGVVNLPAAVLVNEDGYIAGKFEGAESGGEIARALEDMAQSARMKGKAVRDFKLREVRSGELHTLLDVARREYTMLLFLQASSPLCLQELQVLQSIRDKHGDDVGLVAAFQDDSSSEAIRRYLELYGLEPDFVLEDPARHQAETYHFRQVPVLFVIGPDGKIVLSRKGYEQEKSWQFGRELEGFFTARKPETGRTAFSEIRRIRDEAIQFLEEGRADMALIYFERVLEMAPELSTTNCLIADSYLALGEAREAAVHYGRYISANPQAYDLEEVKGKLLAIAKGRP